MRIGVAARAWVAPEQQLDAVELAERALSQLPAATGRVVLVVGTCSGETRRRARRDGTPTSWDLGRLGRAVAERVGVDVPTLVVSTACASSTAAIALGHRLLRSGLADAVIAGGVDVVVPKVEEGFRRLGAIGPGRPFGLPVGMRLGEGAAFVLLQPEAGPPWLAGVGLSADPYSVTAPSPDGAALKRALDRAEAGDVGLIAAHGTGTEANDAAESLVLEERFPDADVVAWKGTVGHTLGAAGALEMARTLDALDSGQLPAVPYPARAFAPKGHGRTTTDATDAALLCAGFGGATGALVFGATARTTKAPEALGITAHLVLRGTPGVAEEQLRPGLVGLRGLVDPVSRHLTSAVRQLDPDPEDGLFVGLLGGKGVSGDRMARDLTQPGRRRGARAFSAVLKNAPVGAAARHAGLVGPTATLVGPHSGLVAVMWAWLEGVPCVAGGVDEASEEAARRHEVALVRLGTSGPRILAWSLGPDLAAVQRELGGPMCVVDGSDSTQAVRALVEATEPVVAAAHPWLGAVGARIER